MYGLDRWLGWACKRNLVGDPEGVDVVGDKGSGMLDGEFSEGATSFVDLVPPLCCRCMRLDIADLRYDGDSWA